MMRNVVQKQ